MAITIEQQPTSPIYSRGPAVFTLSSDNINETNFTFVAKVTVGSTTFTYRKQPNPTMRGIFDLGHIFDNNLDWDISALGTSVQSTAINQVKTFSIVFEEDYTGVTDVAATTAISLVVIKGVREFDTGNLDDAAITADTILSNTSDTLKVRNGGKYIISWFDHSAGMLFQEPVTAGSTDFTQTVAGTTVNFEVLPTSSLGDTVFWWQNRKGGWDFFIATQEGEESTSVNRSTASASEITHGFTTSSNKEPQNAKAFKATSTDYIVSYSKTYTKQTQWISENESNKLEGLYDSPFAYIEEGGFFRPISMSNSSYDGYPRKRSAELFQYELQYTYRNDKRNN